MVVQHNLIAMNSNRMLNSVTKNQGKSTEKLSSGYRINRAADDAAGLSISEKMRKQIRGLTQASANAQDGISAVQTAEGALNEVQDMLQRMNELAVKAANGTNSEDDRSYIQNEIDQLVSEIDRVAETTKFNETYLLKGDAGAEPEYRIQAKETAVSDGIMSGGGIRFSAGTGHRIIGMSWKTGASRPSADKQNRFMKSCVDNGIDLNKVGASITITVPGYTISSTGEIKDADGSVLGNFNIYCPPGLEGTDTHSTVFYNTITPAVDAKTEYFDKNGNRIPENGLDNFIKFDGTNFVFANDKNELYIAGGKEFAVATGKTLNDYFDKEPIIGKMSIKLHVGADATSNNQIELKIADMSSKGIGIDGLKVDGNDDTNALKSIDTVKYAIQRVSTQRSELGAIQNRLDHTINNLDNVVENTTAAESQIRDTDMAKEMVLFSNNNILAQAGQAMLAQANQSNQGVLSLLS